ncbi:hypothetical protein VL12_21165, partial [Rossellomorea marisflavi]
YFNLTDDFQKISPIIINFSLTFLILRLISRGLEVIVAFYKDVVRTNEKVFFKTEKRDNNSEVETKFIQDYKNSILLPKSRISLAVHSLVEFSVLFAITYYLIYRIMYQTEMPYIETLFYSSTLGVFNISYKASSSILLNGLHFWQIMISCVLILIAVAQYVGLNKPFSNEEQLFYKHIQLFSLKQKNQKYHKEIFTSIKKCDKENANNASIDVEIDNYFYGLGLDTNVKDNKEELNRLLEKELY